MLRRGCTPLNLWESVCRKKKKSPGIKAARSCLSGEFTTYKSREGKEGERAERGWQRCRRAFQRGRLYASECKRATGVGVHVWTHQRDGACKGKRGRWRAKQEKEVNKGDVLLSALQLCVWFVCPHCDSQCVNGDVYISNIRGERQSGGMDAWKVSEEGKKSFFFFRQ